MSVYLEAIKVLEKRGWTQTAPLGHGPNGEVCIAQAIGVAVNNECYIGKYTRPVASLLGVRWLSEWNDDPRTTYEDVVLALKRAHEASEATTS